MKFFKGKFQVPKYRINNFTNNITIFQYNYIPINEILFISKIQDQVSSRD